VSLAPVVFGTSSPRTADVDRVVRRLQRVAAGDWLLPAHGGVDARARRVERQVVATSSAMSSVPDRLAGARELAGDVAIDVVAELDSSSWASSAGVFERLASAAGRRARATHAAIQAHEAPRGHHRVVACDEASARRPRATSAVACDGDGSKSSSKLSRPRVAAVGRRGAGRAGCRRIARSARRVRTRRSGPSPAGSWPGPGGGARPADGARPCGASRSSNSLSASAYPP